MTSIKKTLTELLSRTPTREMQVMILKEVKESGKSIEEIADKYAVPPVFRMRDDGTIKYKGEVMTPAQFHERYPFRRYVVITSKRQKELLNK